MLHDVTVGGFIARLWWLYWQPGLSTKKLASAPHHDSTVDEHVASRSRYC